MTDKVMRDGDTVLRSHKPSSVYMRKVLEHISKREPDIVPCFIGTEGGFDRLTYMEGSVPGELGHFSDEACGEAAALIARLHRAGADMEGMPSGMTVCHRDLSPCNFVFRSGLPAAVIDWDAACPGDPLDDLAYAVWMWLDIGNGGQTGKYVLERMRSMLGAYTFAPVDVHVIYPHMLREMARVGASVFPDAAQTEATRKWTEKCAAWCERELKPLL